jgi:hypothetical protein
LAANESNFGALNAAEVPVPSAKVLAPFPEKVDTVPLGRMSLMRWFPESPT